MERAIKYFSISMYAAVLLLTLTVSFSFAQSLTGMGSVRSQSIDSAGQDDEQFASISLTQVDTNSDGLVGSSADGSNFIPETSNYTLGKEDVIEIMSNTACKNPNGITLL